MTFNLTKDAWSKGCHIEALGIRVVPDATKFYQAGKCYLFKTVENGQDRLQVVLSSSDSLRIRILVPLKPHATAVVKDEYQGQDLYEYAVVTKKRDSTQHVWHFLQQQNNNPQTQTPARLVTSKFFQQGHKHRILHAWNNRHDIWGAIYDDASWRVQTAQGVDPILVATLAVCTDRFAAYVDNQHLRRTALLDAKTSVGGRKDIF